MTARKIEWHEACQLNHFNSLERMKAELDRTNKRYLQYVANYNFYSEQINEAKRRKKDSFDSDKFLQGKKK